MDRPVSTGIAILLGFAGLVVGAALLTGLFRTSLPAPLAMVVGVTVPVGVWLMGRRDVAVGMAMGMVGLVLMIVAALHGWGAGG